MKESPDQFWLSFLLFGPFLCILLSAGQILRKEKELSLYYTLAHFTMGAWLFQVIVYGTNLFSASWVISTLILPVSFLAPVFQRYRYSWVFSNIPGHGAAYRFQYAPFVLCCMFLAGLFLKYGIDNSHGYFTFVPVTHGRFLNLPIMFRALHLLYPLSKIMSLVSLISMWYLIAGFLIKKGSSDDIRSIRLSFVIITMIISATLIVFTGDIFSFRLSLTGITLANMTICIIIIVSYRHSSFRKLLFYEIEKSKYINSKLSGVDISEVISRLEYIMNIEKAFADEDLSLKILARELDISQQQLSEILNKKIGKNFNAFVNEYRIDEARRLLVDEPERSIKSIANSVGFNSNTAFTVVFSKYTGCSPSRFRRINGIKF